jgi:hypothetical protein
VPTLVGCSLLLLAAPCRAGEEPCTRYGPAPPRAWPDWLSPGTGPRVAQGDISRPDCPPDPSSLDEIAEFQTRIGAAATSVGIGLGGLGAFAIHWGLSHPDASSGRRIAAFAGGGAAGVAGLLGLVIGPVNLALGASRRRWARRIRESGVVLRASAGGAPGLGLGWRF